MDIWANTVLTDKGRALQLKLLQGQTLQINRAVTGAGKVPLRSLFLPSSPVQSLGLMSEFQKYPPRLSENLIFWHKISPFLSM